MLRKSNTYLFLTAIALVFMASCRFERYTEDGCRERSLRYPRHSTSTRNMEWSKCRDEKGVLQDRSFSINYSGCWTYQIYYEKGAEYFPNGKLKYKYRQRGIRGLEKEYFADGRLKIKKRTRRVMYSEKKREELMNDTTAIYHAGVYRVRGRSVDSITGKVTHFCNSDSLIIRAKF